MTGTSPGQPDPMRETEIRNAEAVLWREVDITDPATGEVARQKIETQLYQDYLRYQTAYGDARMAYTAALEEARKTAAGRNTWPMVAGTLQLPVKQAYDRWRAAGAVKVEQALAILERGSKSTDFR